MADKGYGDRAYAEAQIARFMPTEGITEVDTAETDCGDYIEMIATAPNGTTFGIRFVDAEGAQQGRRIDASWMRIDRF